MFERVKNLRDQFVSATDKEKEKITIELDKLQDENADAFAEAMIECMKETNKNLSDFLMREQLNDILPYISVSAIAKNYFGKSKEWFYQKMNGNIVNGKPAKFTEEEIKNLIDNSPNIEFGLGVSDDMIRKAEEKLEFTFPKEYKLWLGRNIW